MIFHDLTVAAKVRECADAVSLLLDVPLAARNAFAHEAGQFIPVAFDIHGETVRRQYSISSAPGAAQLRLSVKRVAGGRVSNWIVDELRPGQAIRAASPQGRFFIRPEGPGLTVLLAAGSGIAPLLPIAYRLHALHPGNCVHLAYGNRHEGSIMLKGEIDAFVALESRFTVDHALSTPGPDWRGARGRIDEHYIRNNFSSWNARNDKQPQFYLCGPKSFMQAAELALSSLGVAGPQIRKESFASDEQTVDEPPILLSAANVAVGAKHGITAIVGGETYHAQPLPRESLLAALIREGADVPYSCLEGTCASCLSRLVSGSVAVQASVRSTLSKTDLDDGVVLACLCTAQSASVILDFDNP